MRFNHKVVLITGGSTGIGAATAVLLGSEGARVIIADINETDGQTTVERIEKAGGIARFVRTDVTSEEEVRTLIEAIDQDCGRLDVLINGAGVLLGPMVRVDRLNLEHWEKTIDVNLRGTFLCTKHAVPLMEKTGGGVVLCIASGAGVRGASSSLAYGASKGGVQGFAYTLEGQLAPLNIRVHVVCPGGIATPLKLRNIAEVAEQTGQSPEEAVAAARPGLGEPEGVAKVLAFLASEDADYVRGTIFTR